MLDIEDLHVKVGDREVLHDVNLRIKEGETHVLMGPNGSGKSYLAHDNNGICKLHGHKRDDII